MLEVLSGIKTTCQIAHAYGVPPITVTHWKRESYEQKHQHLRKLLFEIARSHTEYGYRRTNAELRER